MAAVESPDAEVAEEQREARDEIKAEGSRAVLRFEPPGVDFVTEDRRSGAQIDVQTDVLERAYSVRQREDPTLDGAAQIWIAYLALGELGDRLADLGKRAETPGPTGWTVFLGVDPRVYPKPKEPPGGTPVADPDDPPPRALSVVSLDEAVRFKGYEVLFKLRVREGAVQ